MTNYKLESIYITKSPEETIELGKRLAYRLKSGDLVLLFGDLGSGKTHFIKGIAEGLGVSVVIKSPTYAYVNRYAIVAPSWLHRGSNGGIISNATTGATKRSEEPKSEARSHATKDQVFYHYDLYRFEQGADIASIGFDESLEDSNAINVVEWADRLGDRLPVEFISVKLDGSGNKRSIKIKFVSPLILSESEIHKYYEEWATPMHVREHCAKVTEVAMKIAQEYIKQGEIINLNLLYPACILHDMNRVCDFKDLNRDRFQEEVTDKKWEKWKSCRREFKGMHHAEIAAKIIGERGFTETAELIRLHRSDCIVEEPDAFDTIEKKIIYYADKRVKHDEIVSLAERFRDGRERYGEFDTAEEKKLFEEVEAKTKQLEKELFNGLGIKPADINNKF